MKQTNYWIALFLLVSLLVGPLTYAQNIPSQKLDTKYSQLSDLFSKYEVRKIDLNSFVSQLQSRSGATKLQLQVNDSKAWNLELAEVNLISKDYHIMVGTETGVQKWTRRPSVKTFADVLNAPRGGEVRLSVADNILYGYVEEAGVKYFFEPVYHLIKGVDQNEILFYSEKDAKPNLNVKCAVTELHSHDEEFEVNTDNRSHCLEVEICLGNDLTMFNHYGSVTAVENRNVAVMNNVQTNYDNEFTHVLEFFILAQYVPQTTGQDPWNGINNINTHLTTHASFGNGGGYGTTAHDVATAWTRKYTSGAIGLAWVPGVCGGNRYNVCSDYGGGPEQIRCLQAHELGHNFNSGHDGSGTWIMSPTVSNSNQWSTGSKNQINGFVANAGCLSTCSSGGSAPDPDFSFVFSNNTGCAPTTVNFTDLSQNFPTSWLWTFVGGSPSSSTAKNPSVVYNVRGDYDVKLKATNQYGSNEIIKNQIIHIQSKPIAGFSYMDDELMVFFTNGSQYGDSYLWNFGDGNTSTDEHPSNLYNQDGKYTVRLKVTNICGTVEVTQVINVVSRPQVDFVANITDVCGPQTVEFSNLSSTNVTVWNWAFPGGTPKFSSLKEPAIIYDVPGIYDVTLTAANSKYTVTFTRPKYIDVVVDPEANFIHTQNVNTIDFTNKSQYGKTYHWNFGDNQTSTEVNPSHTYAADGTYNVVLVATNRCGSDSSTTQIVIANNKVKAIFSTAKSIGCAPFIVDFTNTSTGKNLAYKWTFPGGTPATSIEQNPRVSYAKAGKYSAKLEVTDGLVTDVIEKVDAIEVMAAPTSEFTNVVISYTSYFDNLSKDGKQFFWNFGDNNTSSEQNPRHTYASEGDFLVTLKVVNDCGEKEYSKWISVYLIPKIAFDVDTVEACVGYDFHFRDRSSFDVREWSWEFENGFPNVSTDKNPIVEWKKSGLYYVKLSVRNGNGGNTLTKLKYIKVLSPVLCPEYINDRQAPREIEGENINSGTNNRSTGNAYIAPNPNNGQFKLIIPNISRAGAQVSIIDLLGNTVNNQTVHSYDNNIDVSHLTVGTYYVQIVQNGTKLYSKIVISY